MPMLNAFNTYSYLPVVAGIISEADYVFLPEFPPPQDWPDRLILKLEQASQLDRWVSHSNIEYVCADSKSC